MNQHNVYTCWYIPDGYSEPLTMAWSENDFPPYDISTDEKVDFILNEVYERGEPLEIRGPGGSWAGALLWQNKSWGID